MPSAQFPAYQSLGCYLRPRPADGTWETAHLEPFTRQLSRSLRQTPPDFDVPGIFKRAA